MKKTIIVTISVLAGGVLIAFGAFHYFSKPLIKPAKIANPSSANAPIPKKQAQAVKETITEWYKAVGTVRPRTETRIESLITAKVVKINVRPGSKVTKGQVLIVLDSRQPNSRLDQARQALKTAIAGKKQSQQAVIAAKAKFNQAESDYKRVQTYFKSQAATAQKLERAKSAFLQAKAEVKRAREAQTGAQSQIRQAEEVVKETRIALEYTQIKAPESGEVLKRQVEQGDLALPGKPLLILQTAGALRLEAYVREGLIKQVKQGTELKAVITTLNTTTTATVDEIIPYADPQTRTFLVKATLPPIEGLFPGMFGKLLIPVQELEVVMIPRETVRHVGQLELVAVQDNNNRWRSQFIKTGKHFGDKVEVLSGLSGNETIGY
ncbi:efflux RND transporter periplasmic adaptor subunit [Desulfococcaceae bacterium HSG9]|nr:efflux RND transporter periplasmic adaptor subunit [Desulfococcaceae bacterium HSG9]